MTPERAELLAELLTEVREKEAGYLPVQAFRSMHKLCSWAAVELLIVKNNGQEVLLRYRNDEPWDGWHVIGGYVKPFESIQAFANRAVKEEKSGITSVKNLKHIATSKWLDHPYSFPYCSLIVCEPIGQVDQNEYLRWFSVGNFPSGKMVHPKHELYLETYLKYLKNPERYCPIIGE
jgi:hypothetical protein